MDGESQRPRLHGHAPLTTGNRKWKCVQSVHRFEEFGEYELTEGYEEIFGGSWEQKGI